VVVGLRRDRVPQLRVARDLPFGKRGRGGRVGRAGAVAEAVGAARPGEGARRSRRHARPGRGLPGRCRAAARRAGAVRFGGLGPDGVTPVDLLAGDPKALAAVATARAAARAAAWRLAGVHAPDAEVDARRPLVVDLDATLIGAHAEKEGAAPTFKRGFGHHPLWTFADHGTDGTGEPLAVLLRPGNAGSNTATDHITITRQALAQLPGHRPGTRPGRKVLIRTDGAGATHAFLNWLVGQRLSYSVGFMLPAGAERAIARIPAPAWTPAYDANGQIRDGAFVAELTGLLDLASWPAGMRVIIRKERPHPGAQLRTTDIDGNRITAFRDQHRARRTWRPAFRPRAPAPPPSPLRRPHPPSQRHRPGQPPAAHPRPELHLVRHRRARRRTRRLDPAARPAPARPAPLDRAAPRRPRPTPAASRPDRHRWTELLLDGLDRLRLLPAPT